MHIPALLSKLAALLAVLWTVSTRCVYNLGEDKLPFHVDSEPFKIGALEACKDYLEPGRLGCCNHIND